MNGRMSNDLVRIVANGGGIRISAKAYSISDLVRIAANAARSNARVTICDTDALLVDNLVQIAANGHGAVSFE